LKSVLWNGWRKAARLLEVANSALRMGRTEAVFETSMLVTLKPRIATQAHTGTQRRAAVWRQ
jgi:hypothetical protein